MAVHMRRERAAAIVDLDNPPVNAIGLAVREGLWAALDWVDGQEGLSRVILIGRGRAFAAGGDAREFDGPPVAPHLPDIVNRIEASDVPWVAAVSGIALGGGCELMLGCRYRIAAPGVRIGLPEVTLGVVPGASGTQRLPRLVGMARALDMIATGKPVSAEAAEEMGLVDGIADDPMSVALALDQGTIELNAPVGERPAPLVGGIEAARAAAAKRMRGQIAPSRAIDLVEAAATLSLADGMAQEREAFLTLRTGAQAKALRHVFFAERGAKAPTTLTAEPAPLDHIAVVGGGTMGAGIAYACLNAGLRVTLLETDAEGVERGRGNVDRIVGASLTRGLIDEAGAGARRDRLTVSDDYQAAAGAGLAIEAAFESLEVKRAVFKSLEAALPADAILATNTSYLDVDEIAASVADPSRVLGLHFFAPAHIMKLLEIVQARAASDRALAAGFALAKRLGKVPVLAGVCHGFIGNRILARYREAADTLLLEGAMVAEVDEAMEGFGYAMGPYEAQDLSGLDIAYAARQARPPAPDRRVIPIADRMVQEGKLGKKVGAGWYRYPGGNGKVEDPIVDDLILEEARFAGVKRRDWSADEIVERLICAMVNEAADILAEGIAASATDIDLVTVLGYGFPRWRGGLMWHADTLGAAWLVARLDRFAAEDPVAWAVSPVLRECAASGTSLADWRPEGR